MASVKGGLNPSTMGYALTFFHELLHTKIFFKEGAFQLRDPDEESKYTYYDLGEVVPIVNKIRRQLGSDYGQRLTYSVIGIGADKLKGTEYENLIGKSFIPFDKASLKIVKGFKKGVYSVPSTYHVAYE